MTEDLRDAFFDSLVERARNDEQIVIVTNDMDVFSLTEFRLEFPDRLINVGVAEQNMVNVAAGLASMGKKVIVFGILSFLSTRCYEQIKVNVASMKLPVLFVGIGTGISFSYDGPTHHSTFDISLMRQLPEFQIFNPLDSKSARSVASRAIKFEKPTLVRLDRGKQISDFGHYQLTLQSYEYMIHNEGKKNLIVFSGLNIQNMSEFGLDSLDFSDWSILGLVQVWPLPQKVAEFLETASRIVVIEENSLSGGIFNIIAEHLAFRKTCTQIDVICILNNEVRLFGSRNWLRGKLGMETPFSN